MPWQEAQHPAVFRVEGHAARPSALVSGCGFSWTLHPKPCTLQDGKKGEVFRVEGDAARPAVKLDPNP